MPSKVLNNDSSYYILFHKILEYKSFRVFGCLCYPFIRLYNSHKLQYRSLQRVFLGYSFQNKGYLCLNTLTRRVYVTPHVVFDETKFFDTTLSLTRDSPAEILTPTILPFPSSLPTNISHSPPQSALPFLSDSTRSLSGSTSTPVSLQPECQLKLRSSRKFEIISSS